MTNQSGDRSDSTRDDWRIFVANLRHDLRTPLNAIIGYSEMVLEEAEDLGEEELVDLLNLVVTNGREILGVVDDVLSASRMQSLAEPDWSGFEKELRSGTSERALIHRKSLNQWGRVIWLLSCTQTAQADNS